MIFNELQLKLYYNAKYRQISHDIINNEVAFRVILHSYGLFDIKPWTNNNINCQKTRQ